MQTFKRKAGDTQPYISTALYDNGQPYDLTTSTVRLIAQRASTGTSSSIAGSIVAADEGRVQANIQTLLTGADMFNLEWEVTDGAEILTFPGEGYDRLIVTPDLD